MTPSVYGRFFSMPKAVLRWRENSSNSANVPSSRQNEDALPCGHLALGVLLLNRFRRARILGSANPLSEIGDLALCCVDVDLHGGDDSHIPRGLDTGVPRVWTPGVLRSRGDSVPRPPGASRRPRRHPVVAGGSRRIRVHQRRCGRSGAPGRWTASSRSRAGSRLDAVERASGRRNTRRHVGAGRPTSRWRPGGNYHGRQDGRG